VHKANALPHVSSKSREIEIEICSCCISASTAASRIGLKRCSTVASLTSAMETMPSPRGPKPSSMKPPRSLLRSCAHRTRRQSQPAAPSQLSRLQRRDETPLSWQRRVGGGGRLVTLRSANRMVTARTDAGGCCCCIARGRTAWSRDLPLSPVSLSLSLSPSLSLSLGVAHFLSIERWARLYAEPPLCCSPVAWQWRGVAARHLLFSWVHFFSMRLLLLIGE
jgi:hypothetical protein